MKKLRVLSTVLSLSILGLFSGCSLCETEVYVDRPVKVLIEVPCTVANVVCDINGTDSEVVLGLAECVIDLKMEAKRCQIQ